MRRAEQARGRSPRANRLVIPTTPRAPEGRPTRRLLLLHIAVYGPKLRAETYKLAQERGASIVLCGHSHVPFIGRDRGIVVFNAGSIGPRRYPLPIVFGVFDLGSSGVALRHVNGETGERWEPPG